MSFIRSIPALVAAGAYEGLTKGSQISSTGGWWPTIVATVSSLLVAYASIVWLLRLVAGHPITSSSAPGWVGLAIVIIVMLAAGVLTARPEHAAMPMIEVTKVESERPE